MTRRRPAAVIAALAVTAGCIVAWAATGRAGITATTRFVEIARPPDPDDIMDFARTDPDGLVRETVREDGLRFGMIPGGYPRPGAWTPNLEWLSVATIAGPVWMLAALIFLAPTKKHTTTAADA